jgi:cytoskeletal protein RodZ
MKDKKIKKRWLIVFSVLLVLALVVFFAIYLPWKHKAKAPNPVSTTTLDNGTESVLLENNLNENKNGENQASIPVNANSSDSGQNSASEPDETATVNPDSSGELTPSSATTNYDNVTGSNFDEKE